MIVVTSGGGHLVKVLRGARGGSYGVHSLFGFVGEDDCGARLRHRRRKGLPLDGSRWRCRFHVEARGGGFAVRPRENCGARALEGGAWALSTPAADYRFAPAGSPGLLLEGGDAVHVGSGALWRAVGAASLAFLLLFLLLRAASVDVAEEEPAAEPIEVTVVPDQRAVPVRRTAVAQAPPEVTREERARRAVRRNLGFLGMIGTKTVRDAVGGAPTDLRAVSAGAGSGDAGSGGEFLAGLGKGVSKTTVGNTGVAGLGGVGTKGAGGGRGGYGSVSVASGEGPGVSQVAIGEDLLLEGGLSRYAVQAAIARYLSQVRACYEEGLKARPGMTGTVRVSFEVGASGGVNYSRVQRSSLGSGSVEKCITDRMMGWEFPRPRGGQAVRVNYPFLLRPVNT